MSDLRNRMQAGGFVVTTELEPPKGTDLSELLEHVAKVKGRVQAANVTDNQRSVMRMSSLGGSAAVLGAGLDPILQVTCRDRNRLGMQSDLLTAASLGIHNVLTMTGDPVDAGDHPDAKPVFDITSGELIRLLATLNSGHDLAGNALAGSTDFFIGSTANPGADPLEAELKKFDEKVEAGARFFQTQAVYDLDSFAAFMDHAGGYPVYVLAGLIPLKSAKMARFLNEKVPGITGPDHMIAALEAASDPAEVGRDIVVDVARGLKDLCHGAHVMVVGKEKDFVILDRLTALL